MSTIYCTIALIKRTGDLCEINLPDRIASLSNALLASTAVIKTALPLDVKYFTTC